MFNYYGDNGVSVSNGNMSNIRGYRETIDNGRVTISNKCNNGNKIKTVITVKDSRIKTQRIKLNGKSVYFCEYGHIEYEKGKFTLRFRQGTNKGLDGLSVRHDEKVFGYKGKLKTFYKNGRLIWQRFYHENNKLCFHFSAFKDNLTMKHPDGSKLFEFKGKINSANKPDGKLVWYERYGSGSQKEDWSKDGNCDFTRWSINGNITLQGQFRHKQRTGEWIINNKKVCYLNGLEMPSKLYHTPPEKISVKRVMAIHDADVRSILIGRIGMERIFKEIPTEIVHADKRAKMQLLKMKINGDSPFQILQVTCPSTKQPYYLRVPPTMKQCEQARQWTFGAERKQDYIKFDVET